jgi:hypothetical protein
MRDPAGYTRRTITPPEYRHALHPTTTLPGTRSCSTDVFRVHVLSRPSATPPGTRANDHPLAEDTHALHSTTTLPGTPVNDHDPAGFVLCRAKRTHRRVATSADLFCTKESTCREVRRRGNRQRTRRAGRARAEPAFKRTHSMTADPRAGTGIGARHGRARPDARARRGTERESDQCAASLFTRPRSPIETQDAVRTHHKNPPRPRGTITSQRPRPERRHCRDSPSYRRGMNRALSVLPRCASSSWSTHSSRVRRRQLSGDSSYTLTPPAWLGKEKPLLVACPRPSPMSIER